MRKQANAASLSERQASGVQPRGKGIQDFDHEKSRLKALGDAPFKSLTSTRC